MTTTERFTIEPRPLVNVRNKAVRVAKIFEILAYATIIVGGLGAGLLILGGATTTDGNNAYLILLAIGVVLSTAITWASMALSSIIAGYIAQKATA